MATTAAAGMVERKGLYYPWVHFQSDEWVKKALLVFPGLLRMVAAGQLPNDSLLVYELRSHSLIGHAELGTPNALEAQVQLKRLIEEDLDADRKLFQRLFGREAAEHSGQPSFQMHLGKASEDLAHFLRESKLAWAPAIPEQSEYSELHPDLGQAVMGTLAMACAEDAGLHIVGTDSVRGRDRSAELNTTLIAKDRTGPYRQFVRKELRPAVVRPEADELFHVLVHFNCDVSRLDAISLVRLHAEREPMRVLKRHVQQLVAEIPDMKNPALRLEAFRDRANDIVRAWQNDRANVSKYAREVLALDAIGGGAGKFFDVMQKKLIPLSVAGSIGAAGASGSTGAQVFGATVGLAIGLLTHLGASYSKIKDAENNSPLRYMTLAAERGVAFSVSHIRRNE